MSKETKVKFNDLSTPLKIASIMGWFHLGTFILSIVAFCVVMVIALFI